MNPRTAIYKLQLRLNKLASSDYDNIPWNQAVEAINKAAIEWVRRQFHGTNNYKEGDEESRIRMDDLQFLLKERTFKGANHKLYFESDELPEDYLWYKKILPRATKGECSLKVIKSTLVEESNVPDYLEDWSWKPSFEWQQCFHTLLNNKLRIYTNGDFKINNVDLTYYRRPRKMDIEGYTHETGRVSSNIDLEFKDDIAELILDDAAAILAGDIENFNQSQVTKQRSENNN